MAKFLYVSLASFAAFGLMTAFWSGGHSVWINPLGAFFGSAAFVMMVMVWILGMVTVGEK